MTFGSLFSGCGGLDLGLERAGLECRWQVENDSFCNLVLARHWPEVKRYGDIRNVDGNELEPVDLICGGFPCQDLSQAGKRAGIEGSRSGLWFEFSRLVGELGPRWVLIENVPGLLVYHGMRRVVGELSRLGYVGIWRCLRASEFGASHLRKRIFIVAYQRQRAGHAADDSSDHVAHTKFARSGRSTGQGVRTDGPPLQAARPLQCDGPVEDAGRAGNRRAQKPSGLNRRGPSGHDRGAGRALADAGNGLLPQPWWEPQRRDGSGPGSAALDDAQRTGLEIGDGQREQQLRQDAESLAPGLPDTGELGDPADQGRSRWGQSDKHDAASGGRSVHPGGAPFPFAPGPADPRWPYILRERPDLSPALESPLRGMADGLSSDLDRAMQDRTKRLGRLGNSVVPDCAEWIGLRIRMLERR